MTDELYNKVKMDHEEAHQRNSMSTDIPQWNSSIEQQFNPTIDALFTYDFPTARIPDFNDINCFEFLELNHIPTTSELQEAFRWSNAYLWLYNCVSNFPDETSYFGAITAQLHETLINDPKPYRKEVKELLSNTISWIEFLKIDGIKIDRPQYSQRISINRSGEEVPCLK